MWYSALWAIGYPAYAGHVPNTVGRSVHHVRHSRMQEERSPPLCCRFALHVDKGEVISLLCVCDYFSSWLRYANPFSSNFCLLESADVVAWGIQSKI